MGEADARAADTSTSDKSTDTSVASVENEPTTSTSEGPKAEAAGTGTPAAPGVPAADSSQTAKVDASTMDALETDDAEVPTAPTAPAAPSLSKLRVARGLLVVGALLLVAAIPFLWVNNPIASNDAWLAATAPLAADPTIQAEVADLAAQAVSENVQIGRVAEEHLPDNFKFLAVPLASFANEVIHEEALNLVQSPQFYTLWTKLSSAAHGALTVLDEGSGPKDMIDIHEGEVSLDVGELASALRERLASKGYSFAAEGQGRLEGARVVLVDSPALASAQSVLGLVEALAFGLLVGGVALVAVGLWLTPDRRRGGMLTAGTYIAGVIIMLVTLGIAQPAIASAVAPMGGTMAAAVAAALAILLAPLQGILAWDIALAAIICATLFLRGPSKPAQAVRTTYANLIKRFASDT